MVYRILLWRHTNIYLDISYGLIFISFYIFIDAKYIVLKTFVKLSNVFLIVYLLLILRCIIFCSNFTLPIKFAVSF